MPGLNIVVGANISAADQALSTLSQKLAQTAIDTAKISGALDTVNAALVPLQNNLRSFQNALKTATDPGQVAYLTKQINILEESIQQVKGTNSSFVKGTDQASYALMNLGRVAQDAPFGFIGIQNNINPLLESFQRLKAETGTTGGAIKALAASFMGGGGLGLAVSVATGLFTILAQEGLFKTSKALDDTADAAKKAKDAIHGIFEDTAKEAVNVQSLVIVLESETATRQRKLDAIKELQKIQPEVFAGLRIEGNMVVGLTGAYKAYLDSLTTVIAARIKQQQLEQVTTQILEKQGVTLTGYAKMANDLGKLLSDNKKKQDLLGDKPSGETKTAWDKQQQENTMNLNLLYKQQAELVKDLGDLQAGIKVPDFKDPKPVKEKVDQVAEALRKLRIDQDELAKNPLLSFDEKDSRNADLLLNAINRLRDLKVSNDSAILIKLRAEADEASIQVALDKFRARLKKTGVSDVMQVPSIPISFELRKDSGLDKDIQSNLNAIDGIAKKYNSKAITLKLLTLSPNKKEFDSYGDSLQKNFEGLNKSIDNSIRDLQINVIKNLASGLGKAFIGEGFKPLFAGLLNTFSEGMKALGEALIKYGIQAQIAKLALKSFNPGLAIAAGFALEALGSIVESKIPKLAQGGLAYGPTTAIVGDNVNASYDPEVIAPLSKLRSMIGGEGGGTSHVVVTGSITGNVINLANSRTETTRRRLYGK